MNKKHLHITLLALAFLFAGNESHAQFFFQIPKFMTRYELGYSFVSGGARYEGTYQTLDDQGNLINTSVKQNIKAKGGIGAFVGFYFPVAKLGKKVHWLFLLR